MRRSQRRTAAVAIVGLASVACGACSSSGNSGTQSGASTTVRMNIARWALPLDQYQPPAADISDYAQNLLIRRCMQGKGFSWPVPAVNVSAPGSATVNSSGRRLFTVALAKQYGYHAAPNPQVAGVASEIGTLNQQHLAGAEERTFLSCVRAERKDLPRPSTNLVESDASAAYDSALASPAVVAAANRWYDCMTSLGLPHLPRSPMDMPTAALGRQFGLNSSSSNPTAGERRIAVHDARCRASSGFDTSFYRAEWADQLHEITGNESALEALRADLDRYSHQVNATIARYGH